MRARSVKPGFFKNELLGSADPLYSLIFEGIWCLADREGRLEDRPLRIHVEVNPYRDCASTVLALDWLVTNAFLVRYEVDGQKYLAVSNFRKHQQPHIKEAWSKLPPPKNQEDTKAPCEHRASTSVAALTPDSGLRTPDSGLLTAGTSSRATEVSRGTSDDRYALVVKLQAIYPKGTYSPATWTHAERALGLDLDGGAEPERILAQVENLLAQQKALGNVGTQFVPSPKTFFEERRWQHDIELPAPQAKPRKETATERIERALQRSEGRVLDA